MTVLETFLSDSGYGDNPSFWLLCQAVSESLLHGSKEKQLLEGLSVRRRSYRKRISEVDKKVDDFF